jgi:hypothetical protein
MLVKKIQLSYESIMLSKQNEYIPYMAVRERDEEA